MSDKKYLSGFLSPEGYWYPCGYGEHGDLARELCFKYGLNEFMDSNNHNDLATEGDFVKLGLDYEGATEGGHAFFNHNQLLTSKQFNWLDEHMDEMTREQKTRLGYHLRKYKNSQSELSIDGSRGVQITAPVATVKTFSQVDPSIIFCGKDQKEILKLAPNGDIFVNGRLAENDKSVVDGLRRFLKVQGF